MILGTISGYTSGTGVTLTIDGESSPTTKKYMFLASYTPTVGDRVIVEEISGSYVVIGAVVTTPATVGHASTADTATTATTANTATLAHHVRQYSNTSEYVEFTYFNSNLWVKINGGTQFALAKQ